MTLQEQFKAARRVSTPLIAIRTPDPAATIQALVKVVDANTPRLSWDVMSGMLGLNQAGKDALHAVTGGDKTQTVALPDALTVCKQLPARTIVFVLNAHRYVGQPAEAQAVWNLRDLFKQDRRTVVLLCPDIVLPPELQQDVLVLDEPLPDAKQLETIVRDQFDAGKVKMPEDPIVERCVDALRGLAAYPAEQVTAMSLLKEGIDVDALWERKRQLIEQTPGLKVYRGHESFDDVGGVGQIKIELTRIFNGLEPPRCIVFVDEAEKGMAGATAGVGDNTGVSQGIHQAFLTEMEDQGYEGLMFVGPPGSAKSMVAKAAGRVGGVPTIAMDIGGMKTAELGASEERVRRAWKIVRAVGDGRALVIATCNKLASLSPELKRRFTHGTYFFDLPRDEERPDIWAIYMKRFGLPKQAMPDDTNWTGAEIRNCARRAWRLKITLKEAAEAIIPVATVDPEGIAALRHQAHRRFLSASQRGIYMMPEDEPATKVPRRQIG